MYDELHGLDWCSVHHRKIPGVKQQAGKPCPYCGNPLPLRSQPYSIAADGTPGTPMTRRDRQRIQWHYELLHAEEPDLAQGELWRRAEQAAASRDGPSDAELSQLVYTCSGDDCWFRVVYNYTGGAAIRDVTTWTAAIDGSPIRLVQGAGREARSAH